MSETLEGFARRRMAGRPGLLHSLSFPSDLFREMGEAGLLGAADLGAVARGSALIARETGSLGFATVWASQSMVPLVLHRLAGLPEEVMAGISNGSTLIALAVSEPGAGAHPKHLTTAAARVPGGWKLDGEKAYITNGPIASHVAVLAITGTTGSQKEFSFFLVPIHTPGLIRIDHPQFDFLHPAQHCGFRLAGCTVPESALIGRPGRGYEEIARPFRSIEDALGAGSLVGVLGRAARCAAARLTDETAAAFGELAGIETALNTLNTVVIQALEDWTTETDAVGVHLIAIHDLARRYVEVLRSMDLDDSEPIRDILRDVEKYLEIARTARQIRKARLGQSYFLPAKKSTGKNEE